MDRKKVTLGSPVKIGGLETAEVEVRSPTVGDEEDALQQAIRLKKGKNPLSIEMCLISRVSGVPYDVLRGMRQADYTALRDAVRDFGGDAPQDDDGDDENPMTPENG